MNICIYGGTFDPIHYGHIKMAQEAFKLYDLDRIYFIPSGNSYFKNNVSSANDRYNMTEIAIKDYPSFYIDDIEFKREGPSYSYETILSYRDNFPEDRIFFLIGEDSLRNIHLWRNVQVIFENATILVAGRKQKSDLDLNYSTEFDAKSIIADMTNKYKASILYYVFDCEISSTKLKSSISDEEFLEKWIPTDVLKYIKERKLYS